MAELEDVVVMCASSEWTTDDLTVSQVCSGRPAVWTLVAGGCSVCGAQEYACPVCQVCRAAMSLEDVDVACAACASRGLFVVLQLKWDIL